MTYKLWIDDDAGKPGIADWRNPPDDSWKIAHSSDEAKEIVIRHGIPEEIDFDHDLGLDQFRLPDTSMLFLRWMCKRFPDAIDKITSYNVHSSNPDGARNISSFMESWKRSRKL